MKDPTLRPEYSASYALVVGIDEYVVALPLSYAVSDAESVRTALVSRFGFPEENTRFLVNDQATRSNIMSSYLAFGEEATERDDRLVVFFAGHGLTRSGARGEIGFLVPHDGDPKDLSTLVRWDELSLAAELIKAKHVLFIMDACYSGLILSRSVSVGSVRFLKDMLLRPARQVITAGKADEVVADSGGPRPDHSVFTGHLLDALEGKAATENGIITANGVMSYVCEKVSTDAKSRQTPHYGYLDGDGDLIFEAPMLSSLTEKEKVDEDLLVTIPSTVINAEMPAGSLVSLVKQQLGTPPPHIQLHDLAMKHVRSFLVETSSERLPTQGVPFSDEEFVRRLQQYEESALDLKTLAVCIAYWGEEHDLGVLQKIISRATDQIHPQAGLDVWNDLRWYPILILSYSAGIAALAACRYDSLFALFNAQAPSVHTPGERTEFLYAVGDAIKDIAITEVFKRLPGHKRQYVPRSEYLHKLLQPDLDDILFMGEDYEGHFDEFEVILALAYADLRNEKGKSVWGPVGRFGWKFHHDMGYLDPLRRVVDREKSLKELISAGFFGGKEDRFEAVASSYVKQIAGLQWF